MDNDPTTPYTPGAMPGSTTGGATRNGMGSQGGVGAEDGVQGNDLMRRVVQSAHATIDRLADSAAPHVQRLQQSMSGANDSVHARAGQAREMGDEWTETLRVTVREHPLAAVGMALAAGLLIARITR